MGVIAVHHTKVDTTSSWDGPGEVAKLEAPITASVANGMFAYYESRGAPDDNGDGYPDTKGAYKFPHHNVGAGGIPGDANLRGVNAAMARISQADIPASNIAGIKEHLRAHQEDAKSIGLSRVVDAISDVIEKVKDAFGVKRSVSLFDIGQYTQDQLDADLNAGEDGEYEGPRSFVIDVQTDGKSISVIVTKSDGKLYKAPVIVGEDNSITIGEYSRVEIEYMPAAERGITIQRQADGRVRWFAVPACTAVLNRSGEIDSRALFDTFVNTIERTGEYPVLDFYHFGENIRLGKADWVARDGYAYCASGTFDDTPIARAAAETLEKNVDKWGISIAYIPTKEPEVIRSPDGIGVNVYNAGINRFISVLPEKSAASIMTNIAANGEGVNRMISEQKRKTLLELVGGDETLVKEIEERLDSVNRTVEAEGMVRRDGETTTKETHVIETTTPAAQPEPAAPVAQEARAMTPDDLMTIVNSAEFENKVIEIVKKLAEAPEAEQMLDEAAKTPPPAQDTELREKFTALTAQLETLRESVAALAKGPQEIARELLDDMPEKMKNQQRAIVHPRAVVMPADLKQRGKIDMAAKAADTLAQLGR